MDSKIKLGIIVYSFLLGISCTKIESGPLKPQDIYLSAEVTEVEDPIHGQNVVHCSVTAKDLRDSHRETIVVLVDGDRLTCNGITLSRVDNIWGFTYEADVPPTPDNQYFLTFYKTGQPYSTARAHMPLPFEIEAPIKDFTIGADDELLVRVGPKDSEEFELNAKLIVNEKDGKEFWSQKAKVGVSELVLEPLSVSEKGELPKVDAFAKVRVIRTGKVTVDTKFVGYVNIERRKEVFGKYRAKK